MTSRGALSDLCICRSSMILRVTVCKVFLIPTLLISLSCQVAEKEVDKKTKKKQEQDELNLLFKPVAVQQKVGKGEYDWGRSC